MTMFLNTVVPKYRSSRLQVFFEKGVLKSLFAIFTGKDLCWSLFSIKLKGCRPAALLKRDQHSCFAVNIAESLSTAFL